ncbi:MAG: tetratricopeptide repeat protein [Bacteroidia bacterium]
MKLYEKIILILVAISFAISFLKVSDADVYLMMAISLLSLSYLICSYWLFNTGSIKKIVLPVLSGFLLCISIFSLTQLIYLNREDAFLILPITNVILFIYLSVYLIVKRKSKTDLKDVKLIFARSLITLVVSSFFAYTPITFKPYRKIVYALNNDNYDIQCNLLMFDYTEQFDEAIKQGNCDKAIEYALVANTMGKIWLGIESNNDSNIVRWEIGGTYNNIYDAYKCKAWAAYNNNNFEEALINYKIAYRYLTTNETTSNYWKKEKSRALSSIAFCYKNINKFQEADSLFMRAIEHYKTVNDTLDKGLADLYSGFASSLSRQLEFSYANKLLFNANFILRKDSLNKESREDLVSNYIDITDNYLQQDSLQHALFYINKSLSFLDNKQGGAYCKSLFYYSVCCFKMNQYHKADSILKKSLQLYEKQPKTNGQDIANCNFVLGQICIALAKYDNAKHYLNKGMEITKNNFGINNSRYASYLKILAHLNKITGDYTTSKQQYKEALAIYTQEFGDRNNNLPPILSGLADISITLSEFTQAKSYADSSLSIAAIYSPLTKLNATSLLNTTAYVDYCLGFYKPADTLYNKVLRIINNYNIENDASKAIALNGLGLVEFAKKNYLKADSLFLKSLNLHQTIFSDNHPLTAIVYLNFAVLLIQENKLVDAEQNINKAMQINKAFFKNNHDVFADIFIVFGDVAKKQNQNNIAKEHYKKALDIYIKKFDEKHWKIISTRKKYNQVWQL